MKEWSCMAVADAVIQAETREEAFDRFIEYLNGDDVDFNDIEIICEADFIEALKEGYRMRG